MNISITIICAVYNSRDYLSRFLVNLEKIKIRENFQLIVVDGGSTDGTLAIINQHLNCIDFWCSEPDGGIYDAWNKGLRESKGDWIMFLGADDILIPGALSKYRKFIGLLPDQKDVEFISARNQIIDRDGNNIRIKGWPFEWPRFLREMTVAHPGALHSNRLFKKYGMFDPRWKIVGDYELLLRAGKELQAVFLDEVTVLMSEGGASDSIAAIREHLRVVIKSQRSSFFVAFSNFIWVVFKYRVKSLFRFVGVNIYLKN